MMEFFRKVFWCLLFLPFFMNGQNNGFIHHDKNLASVISENVEYFEGYSGQNKFVIYYDKVKQSSENSDQYEVFAHTDSGGTRKNFKGTMIFRLSFGVRNQPDEILHFGDFNFTEENGSSSIQGKFRMQMVKQPDENSHCTITFKGKFNSENSSECVWWANFAPNNIDEVIFK